LSREILCGLIFPWQIAEKAIFLLPPGEGGKVEKKTMKKRATRQSSCILMSVAIAIAPITYAADQEPIRMAQAIGEDPATRPTVPKKTTKPTTPKATTPKAKTVPAKPPVTPPVTPVEPVAEKTGEEATEPEEVSKSAMYIGIGVAVLLAAGGGGGGGGGGDAPTTPTHP
jgi:hypothetical protein